MTSFKQRQCSRSFLAGCFQLLSQNVSSQVLRELGWSYVSVVHTETAYGTTGFAWNDCNDLILQVSDCNGDWGGVV